MFTVNLGLNGRRVGAHGRQWTFTPSTYPIICLSVSSLNPFSIGKFPGFVTVIQPLASTALNRPHEASSDGPFAEILHQPEDDHEDPPYDILSRGQGGYMIRPVGPTFIFLSYLSPPVHSLPIKNQTLIPRALDTWSNVYRPRGILPFGKSTFEGMMCRDFAEAAPIKFLPITHLSLFWFFVHLFISFIDSIFRSHVRTCEVQRARYGRGHVVGLADTHRWWRWWKGQAERRESVTNFRWIELRWR
ncbi:hypothetical protein QQP08_024361 [Theobroma cacao]|nr:hypothetical protein QQP08_024361 [Theobroma cacao]